MAFIDPARHIESLRLSHQAYVADFGAGSGSYALAAAQAIMPHGVCYAVDLNRELLNRVAADAKHKSIHNIKIIWGDLEREGGSKLPNASMDAVLLCNTLFQLENKKAALLEAKRVLKDKGRLLIVDWSGSFGGVGPRQDHVISEAEAKKITEEVGFSVDYSLSGGDYHYGFVATKHS
jgi:ubiquinone/menaquinone biosynthesis C-methylase UbiE